MPSDYSSTTPPSLPRKPRARRIIVFCSLPALILIAAIVGYYTLGTYNARREWDAYARDAAARGLKLNFADYLPPAVPDEENFASLPMFDATFQAAEKKEPIPNPFKLPPPKTGKIPPLSTVEKGQRINLVAFQKYLVETGLLPSAGDNAGADVLKALNRFAEPLAALRRAETRPHCRFPVHWQKGLFAELPHNELLMDANKLFALQMAANLATGDNSAALSDLQDDLRLRAILRNEPAAIHGLVRLGIVEKMVSEVWDGLAARQWKDADLKVIEDELGKLDLLEDYFFCMNSERCASNETIFDFAVKNPQKVADLFSDRSDLVGRGVKKLFGFGYPKAWYYGSKLRWNHLNDELLARVDLSQRRWHVEMPTPSASENIQDEVSTLRFALFKITASATPSIGRKWLRTATTVDQARLACALERYRQAHGEFPATLSELAPEFLSKVPLEFVNGEPYHYRRTDDGRFVLYSVGSDLHDDGGMFDPKASLNQQRDWIWSYPER